MKGISRLLLIVAALSLLIVPVAAQDNELEANKALAFAWWEAETAREYDRMGEFFTEDVVRHSVATATVMPEVQVTNLDEYAQFLQETAAMFPDYRFTPQMLVAEGDYVAWYGVFSGTFAENDNSLEVPFGGLFRYEERKIAEVWTEWDNITWGGQMNEGAPPAPIAGYEPPVAAEFDLEANKALVMAFAEAELTRNYDEFDELTAENFVRHSSATADVQVDSREAFKAFLQATAEQFPDYTNTAQVMVAEGDLVALYTSMSGTFAPTGQAVEFPHLDFFRIEDGKIAELWVEWDNLSVMMQMGVLPPPEPVEETISAPTSESMTYYITVGTANVRECPRTDCTRVTTFAYGAAMDVIGTVEGENTLGSNQWREIRYQDQIVYVHSALTSLSAPPPAMSIILPGDVNWFDSGIWVNAGDTFTISASGEVNPCVDHPEVAVCYPHSAAGLTEVGTVAQADPERAGNYPQPDGIMATVVGRIGQGQPFEVGEGGRFRATSDGMLQFRINDEPLNNNQGTFTLRVIVYP